MRLLLLLFSLCLTGAVNGQQREIDSLRHLLKMHSENDSIRLNLLVTLTENMTYSDPKAAFRYVEEALDIASDLEWQKGKVLALRQKGNLYYVMADNLNALDAFQKALQISQNNDYRLLASSLLSNIGNIHADLKEYDKALEHYESFLATSEALGHTSNQVKALTNMAIIFNDIDEFDKGIAYLERALNLAKQENNQFFVAAITNNLALAYKGLERYDRSLRYYQEAADIARNIENKYIEASALNSLGKVNILLQNYDLAGKNGAMALELSKEIGALEWQADSWAVLSTVYEHQGKTKEALDAYKKHIQFRDSVLSEEKKSEITRMEMQFQMEKQQAYSDTQLKREQLVKNGYLVGAIMLLLASVIGYLLYKRRRDALEKGKIAEFKAKVAETQLIALRAQMNPHFIFNSLNSISDLIAKNDAEKANEYLIKFSKLTRSILENSEKKWISLEEDLELMALYIQIEAIRLQGKLTYSIVVDKDIDMENTLIPPLILQPFVENSIWHGLSKKEEGGQINIEVKRDGGTILCSVEDNGVGRNDVLHLNKKNKALGVKITKNRLDIINQLENANGKLSIIDRPVGLRVEIELPLELEF